MTTHIKALEQNEAHIPKRSRCKEIFKFMDKTNKIETRIIQRNNQSRTWFLEKINKINMPLKKLMRGHRDSRQINKTKMERETINSRKLENVDEMFNFLDRYQIDKLHHDQINILNSPITPKRIETDINSLPTKHSPEPDGISTEFHQIFKQDLIRMLSKISHKIETEGSLPN